MLQMYEYSEFVTLTYMACRTNDLKHVLQANLEFIAYFYSTLQKMSVIIFVGNWTLLQVYLDGY